MVRTLSLLTVVVLVMAVAGPVAAVEAGEAVSVAEPPEQPRGDWGAVESTTVPTNRLEIRPVEDVTRAVLTTAQVAEEPPVVLAPVAGASRYGDTETLGHDTRKRLFDAVVDRPGIHLAGLADAVGEPLSTVRYHSRVLQSDGLIDAEKHRGHRRLFPVTVDGPDRALQTALASEAKRSVLLSVARTEPASVTNVARELDRAPSTISHHLTQLESDGLVVREREGETVVTRLSPSVRSELTDGD